jgi:gas vesicle protein
METVVEMKKSISKILTRVVAMEGLECCYSIDDGDKKSESLDILFFHQLDVLLSKYKKNVDEKQERERSIQNLKKEIQDLEDKLQKCMESDMSQKLLYPPKP